MKRGDERQGQQRPGPRGRGGHGPWAAIGARIVHFAFHTNGRSYSAWQRGRVAAGSANQRELERWSAGARPEAQLAVQQTTYGR